MADKTNDNMIQTETIGHWYKNARTCSKSSVLTEVRRDTFSTLLQSLKSIPPCPCSKKDNPDAYREWKAAHLPILYFTMTNCRPDRDTAAASSRYAVIDIDGDCTRFTSNHPAVCFTNYTSNGTHIFIHSCALGSAQTPSEWQEAYNSIAYEVWSDLSAKYGSVKFDGRCAMHTQGAFLWNTEWVRNPNCDMSWMPYERHLGRDTIMDMYSPQSYTDMTRNVKGYGSRKREEERGCEIIKKIASNNFSKKILKDFNESSPAEFVAKYSDKYSIVTGTEPVFSPYTDYLGNTYEMYETRGEMVRLWQPYMTQKCNLDDNGNYKIKEGSRHGSLFAHMMQLCIFLNDKIDPDYLLYDACHWVARYFENPKSFGHTEIMSVVTSVLKSYYAFAEDWTLWHDKRMFVSGIVKLDTETGECVTMDKGMKIGANARCRKTSRILELAKMWDPEKNYDDNVRFIRDYCDKLEKKSDRTLKEYIECAKNMPELMKEYPWLNDIVLKGRGRKKQPVIVENIETGEMIEFQSKKECCEWLGISAKHFDRFKNGKTKQNKIYKVGTKYAIISHKGV